MKKLSLGKRLSLSFGFVILLTMMLSGLAYLRIDSLNDDIKVVVKDRYPETVFAVQIKTNLNEISRSLMSTIIMTDPEQIKKELENVDHQTEEIDKILSILDKRIVDKNGIELLKTINQVRDKFKSPQKALVALIKDNNKDDAQVKFLFQIRPNQGKYFKALDAFIAHQNAQMELAGENSSSQARSTKLWILSLAVCTSVISVIIAILVTRSIVAPLISAVVIARRVAEGDLSSNIEVMSHDETGQMMQALKNMNNGLMTIVREVRTATDSIATASSQIAAGNSDLSSRTEKQANALADTDSSMKDLTSMVRHSAENARQANQLAASASDVALHGGEVVAQVIATMGSINSSSNKIVDIISVIDSIAFQTNILALNAAVEAARAGEQGRGFAVVAAEVRNLAQRSASAAKEIKILISNSVDQVKVGSNLVAKAGTTMDDIVTSVKRVTDIITELTAASQEQSSRIDHVSASIGEMDEVTQQNAALVEQAAAAADSMQQQAANLAKLVSIFKLEKT